MAMMAFEHVIQAEQRAPAAEDSEGRRLAVIADLRRVSELLGSGNSLAEDAASLLLDGALRFLAGEWFALRGLDVPPVEHLLVELQRRDGNAAPFVGRLRLALRAPDSHARLVQCWELMYCINQLSDDE